MLNTSKIRNIYSKIQNQLFSMIPEKWSSIYLYASVIDKLNNIQAGEMFFYYYPSSILVKKKPVSVYEVPNKFNVSETAYMKLVKDLYGTIKELWHEYKISPDERLWSSITISIVDSKFTIEFDYEDLIHSKYTPEDRHLIWKCKYLNYPIDVLNKYDRVMVEDYLTVEDNSINKEKEFQEGMYKNKQHNDVEYGREENLQEREERIAKENGQYFEIVKNTTRRQKKNIEEKYNLHRKKIKIDNGGNKK